MAKHVAAPGYSGKIRNNSQQQGQKMKHIPVAAAK
jgi:hypothetical protein